MSSSLTTNTVSTPSVSKTVSLSAQIADYVELTKPRIVVLELIAVLIALHIATGYGAPGSSWSTALMLAVALGTALVAGSANAINQWYEQDRDALMSRTSNRPLPAGRLSPEEALVFGVVTLSMGCTTLWQFAGAMPALVAFATWLVYVAIYTPLKTLSWTNTIVGAISGAMPLAIGWTAGGGTLGDSMVWHLIGVMYLWQFPHFMAIAWICREDYLKADYQMSTTLDQSGWWAGVQAIVGSILLVPVSLLPLAISPSINVWAYGIIMFLAGIAMLKASATFHLSRDMTSARKLMRYSLLYIPIWLAALWFTAA